MTTEPLPRCWYETGYILHHWDIPDWEHPASNEQKRLFFALCNELKYNVVEAKDRAKRLYRLISFSHISKVQISKLIDQLQLTLEGKKHDAQLKGGDTNGKSEIDKTNGINQKDSKNQT
jgi:hypothetical protein